jgi:hypothetical protein
MLNSILETLFGCSHRTTSFPLTPARRMVGQSASSCGNRHATYIVCLDCGKEFGYDWNTMRLVTDAASVTAVQQTSPSPANQ